MVQKLQCQLVLPKLMMQNAEHLKRISMPRFNRDDLLVQKLRLIQTTGAMERQSFTKQLLCRWNRHVPRIIYGPHRPTTLAKVPHSGQMPLVLPWRE